MSFEPSQYQQDIYDFAVNGTGCAIVEAKAGSGKTRTIEECCKRLNPGMSVIYLVFNKKNQIEASTKLPTFVEVRTLNSFGHSLCNKAFGYSQPDARKVRNTFRIVTGYERSDQETRKKINKCGFVIERLVSLLRGHAEMDISTYMMLAKKHGLEIPDISEFESWLRATYDSVISNKRVRDFDDQLFMPVAYDVEVPFYDMVFIDECQDLNPVKIKLVERLKARGARVIAVGDTNQAIYGFAGADVDSMKHLSDMLDGTKLPLSVNYRCGKAIIREAQRIVPEIEYWDKAIDGLVQTSTKEKYRKLLKQGDYILCRVTAPLVSECLRLIREGKKAVVLGREVAESLYAVIDNCGDDATPIEEALLKLNEYYNEEYKKYQRVENDSGIMILQDKVDTLRAIFESCERLGQTRDKINEIFSDTVGSITFMSVHKSKGLEADNVFILDRSKMPHPLAKQEWQRQQEKNLQYVAITRARKVLTYVD